MDKSEADCHRGLPRVLSERTASSGVSATSYEGTPENPTEAAVLDAVAAYKEADCDDVVASSGGSSMDLAKVVALAVTKDGCAYSNPPPCTADDYVQLFGVALAS